MLLKNPLMRHGIAFLEPKTVEFLGYQTADREALQRSDFARGLRVRMGSVPLANVPQISSANAILLSSLPLEPVNVDEDEAQQPTLVEQPARAPLREISPPPEPSLNPPYNDDANLEPRRRKVPSVGATQASTTSSVTLVPSNNSTSHYFSSSNSSASTGLNGFNLSLTTAQASQAPVRDDDDDDENLFNHFDSIDFFVGRGENGAQLDENVPPLPPAPSSSTPATSATNIAPSSTSDQPSVSRPLAQEDSVEIVSFTLSQAATRSLTRAQIKGKDKEKEPEPQTSIPSNTTHANGASTPTDIELDLDLLTNLDEVEAARFSDPEFLRQQQEELDRLSAVVNPVVRTAAQAKSNGKDARPIKPLPRTRRSLSSQSQSQSRSPQSQHSQPRSQNPVAKDVIEIDLDESGTSSPRVVHSRQVSILDPDDDDIEILGDDYQEEEYDKENMPVMTRHVRRKVTNTQGGGLSVGLFGSNAGTGLGRGGSGRNDVIELSDED